MQHSPELERWILAELPADTESVLDLGCGVGRTGFLLWEQESEGSVSASSSARSTPSERAG